MSSSETDFVLRPARPEDAGRIATLCNALTRMLYESGDVDEAGVRDWFTYPDLGMFAVEQRGELVGYCDVRRDAGGTRFPIDLRVDPGAWGGGVADALLERAESWAREQAAPGALARGYVPDRDTEVRGALERCGHRLVRHSFQMQIDLEGRPDPPAWPDGVTVRTFEPGRDELAVYECHQESFADHWDFHRLPIETWRRHMLEGERFDPALWWLAEANGELAGVALNAWHFSGDRTWGWIGDLGVRRPWRRRGLALALLQHSFADFARRGATRVGLGVDAENTTGAVRLYERAGMRPVRRSDTYEKPLA